MGLVALWHVGSSQTKDQMCVHRTGRQLFFLFFFTTEPSGKPSTNHILSLFQVYAETKKLLWLGWRPRALKGPALVSVLCWHHLEILNTFELGTLYCQIVLGSPYCGGRISKLDESTKVLSFFSTKRKIIDFWRPSQLTCQIFPGTFQLRENIYMCNSQRRYRQIWSVQQVLLIAWRKMIFCVKLRPFSQPYTRSLLLLLFYLFASLFKIFILLVEG